MIPEATIFWAIFLGLLIIPIFFILGHLSAYFHPPMRRLKFAAFIAIICWLSIAFIEHGSFSLTLAFQADLIAGFAILISASIGSFLVISLLSWGFTVTMLLDLEGKDKGQSASQWKGLYGNEMGFDYFVSDRVALLNRLGVSHLEGDIMSITNRGRLITAISGLLLWYFNVIRFNSVTGNEND